ncbi:MAG: S4 domain-containing protein, partial [Planctomycetota bacterium]
MQDEVKIKEYEFEIEEKPHIDRLDAYLAEHFPDYSRTFIKKLMEDDGIIVNSEPVKPSYTPKTGDVVVAQVPVQMGDPIQPEDISLDVVYEDEWIIVVNKPWDMVVHPS